LAILYPAAHGSFDCAALKVLDFLRESNDGRGRSISKGSDEGSLGFTSKAFIVVNVLV
jgi:hypothetical protein